MTQPVQGKPRGRPPQAREGVRINIILTLYPGSDDDLLAWFAALPEGLRAPSVKLALRQGGASVQAQAPSEDEELDDAAFAALLDAL